MSVQKQDYADPKLQKFNNNNTAFKLDNKSIRASHFQLGDISQQPLDQYLTSYNASMQPKNTTSNNISENINFKNSKIINGDGSSSSNYTTENRAKLEKLKNYF